MLQWFIWCNFQNRKYMSNAMTPPHSPAPGSKKGNTRVFVLVLRSILLQHLKYKSTPITRAKLPSHKGTELSLCLRDDNKERRSRSNTFSAWLPRCNQIWRSFNQCKISDPGKLSKFRQFEVSWSSFVSVFTPLDDTSIQSQKKLKRLTFVDWICC